MAVAHLQGFQTKKMLISQKKYKIIAESHGGLWLRRFGLQRRGPDFRDAGRLQVSSKIIWKVTKIFWKLKNLDRDLADSVHDLDMKLVLDFIPNHSSDQHEWFQRQVVFPLIILNISLKKNKFEFSSGPWPEKTPTPTIMSGKTLLGWRTTDPRFRRITGYLCKIVIYLNIFTQKIFFQLRVLVN